MVGVHHIWLLLDGLFVLLLLRVLIRLVEVLRVILTGTLIDKQVSFRYSKQHS